MISNKIISHNFKTKDPSFKKRALVKKRMSLVSYIANKWFSSSITVELSLKRLSLRALIVAKVTNKELVLKKDEALFEKWTNALPSFIWTDLTASVLKSWKIKTIHELNDFIKSDLVEDVKGIDLSEFFDLKRSQFKILVNKNSIDPLKLETINLQGFFRLDDASLIQLVEQFKNLTHIDLTWCEDISDKGITIVAAQNPYLRSIQLNGCRKISYEGILEIITHCKYIGEIGVLECGLSGIQYDALCQKFPTINFQKKMFRF